MSVDGAAPCQLGSVQRMCDVAEYWVPLLERGSGR